MVSKKNFVDVLMENGGKFDEDLRVWKVPNKNRNGVEKFLDDNTMPSVVSKKDDRFVKVICDDGGIVFLCYEKKYRRKGVYHVFCESADGKPYIFECGSWKKLKKFVSEIKANTARIYDDNGFAVAKSLWRY